MTTTTALRVPRARVSSHRTTAKCPACTYPLGNLHARCSSCGTAYHQGCLKQDGCQSMACQKARARREAGSGSAVSRAWAFVVEQNCFYLLSALLMLLGCFLLMMESSATTSELSKALRLQGLMGIYQGLVTALSLYVYRTLRIENDGFNLACISIVLALDPTFFAERFYASSTTYGLLVGGVNFVFSAIYFGALKLGGFPISGRAFGTLALASAVPFFTPLGISPATGQAPSAYFAALWFAPLLLAVSADRWRWEEPKAQALQDRLPYARYLSSLLLYGPAAITVGHLLEMGAVFGHPVELFHLAPVALALGVLAVKSGADLSDWRLHLPGAAAMLAVSAGVQPVFDLGIDVSPRAITLLATASVAGWLFSLSGRRSFLAHAGVAVLMLPGGNLAGFVGTVLQEVCWLLGCALKLVAEAAGLVAGFAGEMLRAAGGIVGPFFTMLGNALAACWDLVSPLFSAVWWLVGCVLQAIGNCLAAIFQGIVALLSALAELAAPLFQAIGTVLGYGLQAVGAVLKLVFDVIGAVFGLVLPVFGELLNALGACATGLSGVQGAIGSGPLAILLGFGSLGVGLKISQSKSAAS